MDHIHEFLGERGLRMPSDSLSVCFKDGRFQMHCLIFAKIGSRSDSIGKIAVDLSELDEVEAFEVTQSSRA